ncbi:hypothetical protein [Sphingomonas crocodyli]|uniref:Uncharacterized protein n=1 Tax=Sphingomonas crocodyli TaxID=1979270 RepID=A0A437LVJ9_9SPHN|nr:hypothetical protein [Sphingomonas crocodyli]RVT89408.1 hypothetical protein EOD43_21830 [Sphingomonas crocodyli]
MHPLTDIRRVADDQTQRIRIGITGLAAVLLLVLFAAAVVGFRTRDAAQADNEAVLNNETAAVEAPKDPLAELGVAPGGQPSTTETAPPAPEPAPPTN